MQILILTIVLLAITVNTLAIAYLTISISRFLNANTQLTDKKPLKMAYNKPFFSKKPSKKEESTEERKARIILENIDNYGTSKMQKDIN